MARDGLDDKFVQSQKEKLEQLQGELRRVRDGLEEDARDRAEDEGDFSEHDAGDMSRSIFNREMDATVGQAMERRLEDIERALEKIEEGSYGVCDDTGEEIPRGRLEAIPEAIRTVEAQQSFERERRPPV
jgi:DnaK suppressor protein